MRHWFTSVLLVVLSAGSLRAQLPTDTLQAEDVWPCGTLPDAVFVPSAPPDDLFGTELRTWLKANWYTEEVSPLSYDNARRAMYDPNGVDWVSPDNTICVYTGYNDDINSNTYPQPINTEHTIPQSFFDQNEPYRGDIHHLFPTHENTNSARSDIPFGEVPDGSATWYGSTTPSGTATQPSTNIETYSEREGSIRFEPREDHKGDVARALFYFYTMHPGVANRDNDGNTVYTPPAGDTTGITRVVYSPTNNTAEELLLLYSWHQADPPSTKEINRNVAIAEAQGNYNPYVIYPEIVARAFAIAAAEGNSLSTNLGAVTSVIAGNSLTVNWTAVGTYNAGNEFTVQLSDAAGSFSSPTVLGSLDGTGNGSLSVPIPTAQAPGSGYLVRVVSSDPAVTGSPSSVLSIVNGLSIASSVPAVIAREEEFSVDYEATGQFTAGNEFQVVLSSSTGSFSSGTTVIGTLSSTALAGTVVATMPADAPLTGGTPLVRIRLEATQPSTISNTSGTITITLAESLEPSAELKMRLRVFPNPTFGAVRLQGELEYPDALSVTVFDSQGRRIHSQTLPAHSAIDHQFDLSAVPPGLYSLQVIGREGSAIWRVVRQ